MESVHITQAELVRDIGAILERVERGAEFLGEISFGPAQSIVQDTPLSWK